MNNQQNDSDDLDASSGKVIIPLSELVKIAAAAALGGALGTAAVSAVT